MKNDKNSGRREFLGTLTAGAAAMGIAGILAPDPTGTGWRSKSDQYSSLRC